MSTMQTAQRYQPTNAVAAKLAALAGELRATIGEVEDVQAKAILETGAEVLGGLRQAFLDYADGAEAAWQR